MDKAHAFRFQRRVGGKDGYDGGRGKPCDEKQRDGVKDAQGQNPSLAAFDAVGAVGAVIIGQGGLGAARNSAEGQGDDLHKRKHNRGGGDKLVPAFAAVGTEHAVEGEDHYRIGGDDEKGGKPEQQNSAYDFFVIAAEA